MALNLAKLKQDIKQNLTTKEWEALQRKALFCATTLPLTMYRLYVINPDSEGLTDKQILSIENTLRNALKKHPYVKVFIVKSTTDSDGAYRAKVGRRTVVMGKKKVAPHVHIGAVGSQEKSAREYVHYVSERLKLNGISIRNKTTPEYWHKINYVTYCYRQADTFHQYGNKSFDFKEYLRLDLVTPEKAFPQKHGKNRPKRPRTSLEYPFFSE